MKWIGQHIWDFISRFRSDVYLEATETGTIASGGNLGLDSNNKIVKAVSGSGDLTITNAGDNRVVTSTGGTGLEAEASLFFDAGSFSVSSATSTLPQMYLINDNADANGSQLWFNKLQNGADDDVLGVIKFVGDDEGGGAQSFVEIFGSISDATPGDESGKLEITVATNSNESRQALTATGLGTGSRVDVGLGYGAASLTTIAGTLTMGSTAFVNNSGVVQVATQGTIDHDSLANFVANEHIDWTGDVSASSVIHTNNITDLHGAGVNGSANQLLTDDGDGSVTSEAGFTWDGDDMLVTSATSNKPVVEIKNTTNDGTGATLRFNNTHGGNDGGDGDYLGTISFLGMDDGTPTPTEYANIFVRVSDATSTEESGMLFINVANHDGGLGQGLRLIGGSANNEVDVDIGLGTDSLTTIAGDLTVTTEATISSRKFTVTSSTDNDHNGDVIYTGSGTTTLGNVVYMRADGAWADADADAETQTNAIIGIALGTDPPTDGVLIKGMYTLDHDVGNDQGVPIYLSQTAGQATATAPSASGKFVRVLGYNLGDDDQIWFDPDKTYIEIA